MGKHHKKGSASQAAACSAEADTTSPQESAAASSTQGILLRLSENYPLTGTQLVLYRALVALLLKGETSNFKRTLERENLSDQIAVLNYQGERNQYESFAFRILLQYLKALDPIYQDLLFNLLDQEKVDVFTRDKEGNTLIAREFNSRPITTTTLFKDIERNSAGRALSEKLLHYAGCIFTKEYCPILTSPTSCGHSFYLECHSTTNYAFIVKEKKGNTCLRSGILLPGKKIEWDSTVLVNTEDSLPITIIPIPSAPPPEKIEFNPPVSGLEDYKECSLIKSDTNSICFSIKLPFEEVEVMKEAIEEIRQNLDENNILITESPADPEKTILFTFKGLFNDLVMNTLGSLARSFISKNKEQKEFEGMSLTALLKEEERKAGKKPAFY